MIKRTVIGATILAVIVGVYLADTHLELAHAPFTSGLGALLFLGALYELLLIGEAKPERRVIGVAAGAAWMLVLAAAALRPDSPWARAGDLLTAASAVAGLLIASQLRYGPGPSAHRLSGSLWFQVPYVGGVACLVALALAGGLRDAMGVVLVAKSSDIGAYFTGKAMGRRKLMPKVSPGKTLEGCAGGLVLSAVVAIFLLEDLGGAPVPGGAVGSAFYGAVIAFLAMTSDLTESLIKRSRGVKDSGRLLAEAGGLLDLVDSLLLVGPFTLAYTVLLASS
jgi:phosphatidate cytidylyltransferase